MRVIMHVDMDAFFCAVETLLHPEYAGKPLIVGGYKSSPRAVVSSCSYEARRFGVRSAMPIAQAARLCPQAIFTPPSMREYQKVSNRIHAIFETVSPLVEPVSIDEAFIDMTGCEHFYPDLEAMGRSLQDKVLAATGCSASVGIAPCKYLAKLASDMRKPRGLVVIRPAEVDAFLLPLPVRELWGVGEKTAAALARCGVQTVADLRQKTERWLNERFGKYGSVLYELARGIDNRPVEPPGLAKSIGHEVTFAQDLPPGRALDKELQSIASAVAARLQRDGRYGRVVVLKLRFADFTTLTRRMSLPGGTGAGGDIAKAALSLLRAIPLKQPVRLLGIYISDLSENRQLSLFADPREQVVEQLLRKLNTGGSFPRVTTAANLAETSPDHRKQK